MQTGPNSDHPFLAQINLFNPIPILLLHDMGPGLADHRSDGIANGNEWRTPPLWGIGLTQVVGGHTNFLHDGRARNLEEILCGITEKVDL
nr:di-heme oxidoredictase family protein [Candidatus Brachybacter algidus]